MSKSRKNKSDSLIERRRFFGPAALTLALSQLLAGCGIDAPRATLATPAPALSDSTQEDVAATLRLNQGALPATLITGLGPYAGKRAALFAVSGREGSIGLPGASIRMRSIQPLYSDKPEQAVSYIAAPIANDGTVGFSAMQIARNGFEVANYLVLLIQEPSQPEPFLRNADGSIAADRRSPRVVPTEENTRGLLLAWIKLDRVQASASNGTAKLGLDQFTR
jgi:hypothetical protein